MPTVQLDKPEALAVIGALRYVAVSGRTADEYKHMLYGIADRIAAQMPETAHTEEDAAKAAERERLIDALRDHIPEYDHKDQEGIIEAFWHDHLANMSDDELLQEYTDRCGPFDDEDDEDEDFGKPAPTAIVDIDANGNPHNCTHPVVHTEGQRAVCSVCRADLGDVPPQPGEPIPEPVVETPAPAPAAPEVPETFPPFTL